MHSYVSSLPSVRSYLADSAHRIVLFDPIRGRVQRISDRTRYRRCPFRSLPVLFLAALMDVSPGRARVGYGRDRGRLDAFGVCVDVCEFHVTRTYLSRAPASLGETCRADTVSQFGKIVDIWSAKAMLVLGITWVGAFSIGIAVTDSKIVLFILRALAGLGYVVIPALDRTKKLII